MSVESQFLAELQSAGIPFSGPVQIDDRLHRYKGPDDKEPNCWYILRILPANNGHEPLVVGGYGSWKMQLSVKWSSRDKSNMSREEWGAASRAWKESDAKRAADEKAQQDEARKKAQSFLVSFPRFNADGLSPYLMAKGINPEDAGPIYISNWELYDGWLALPLQDVEGIVHSFQFIGDDGAKKFLYRGRIIGCFFLLSTLPLDQRGGPIVVCEGYATGASIARATGWPVVCAMNCGNLLPVCKSIRLKFPARTIVIAADNDTFTDGNPGLTKATEAAKQCNALVCTPEFSDSVEMEKPTDFNDLAQSSGLEEVGRQIRASLPLIAAPIGSLQLPPDQDPTELIKYRYLCEAGALLIPGPTGIGKSGLLLQMAACFSINKEFFGVKPSKPLKTLLIQAENDDGDLAQMRDGICRGLELDEDERYQFFQSVLVHTSVGVTGLQFCSEVLRPLLELHAPNIVIVDPALSYVGGDVNKQDVVGGFLRNGLNPQLFEHRAGCMLSHHTSKPPTTRDRRGNGSATRMAGDMAYSGSGSAEFANWARGILALEATRVPGLYRLHAAKRGARLGWRKPDPDKTTGSTTDEDGNERTVTIFERYIAWSRDRNIICWREPDASEVDEFEDNEAGSGSGGAGSDKAGKYGVADMVEAFNTTRAASLTANEWRKVASDEKGISKSTFFRLLKRAVANGQVIKSATNGRYQIVTPNTQDT